METTDSKPSNNPVHFLQAMSTRTKPFHPERSPLVSKISSLSSYPPHKTHLSPGHEARAALLGPSGGGEAPDCLPWWQDEQQQQQQQQQQQPQPRARRQRQHQGPPQSMNQISQTPYNFQSSFGFQDSHNPWGSFSFGNAGGFRSQAQGGSRSRRSSSWMQPYQQQQGRQQRSHHQPGSAPRYRPRSQHRMRPAARIQKNMFPNDLTAPKPPPIEKGMESTSTSAQGTKVGGKTPRLLPKHLREKKVLAKKEQKSAGPKVHKAPKGKKAASRQVVVESSEEDSGLGSEKEESGEGEDGEESEEEEERVPAAKAKARKEAKAVPVKTKTEKKQAPVVVSSDEEVQDSDCSTCSDS